MAASAACFLVAAVAWAALIPEQRDADPLITVGLVVGYALALRVRFESGGCYASAEQLALVPLLLLGPLPYVPLLVAAAGVLAIVPDVLRSGWHRDRWLGALADGWICFGGLLVLALLAPGPFDQGELDVYGVALAAHFATDFAWTLLRNRLVDRLPLGDVLASFADVARVDVILTPVAFVIAAAAASEPLALLAGVSLSCLLRMFTHDRRERYSRVMELQRAYRGTVLVLADIVELEDPYTAEHSRALVELVDNVADRLGMDEAGRQELEFAALLHDVGKIAIPTNVLQKPGPLTPEEMRVIQTHTIEGQFMLDRVGGLLCEVGEIVRSSHERWDGHGYPDGLAGEEIPLAARIIGCCDAWNAMTTDRVYREKLSPDKALAELHTCSGTQFDPHVAAAVTRVVERPEEAPRTVSRLRPARAGLPQPGEGAGS